MSTSRLYVSLVIAVVVCVILSAGAAWGVSSLVLAGNTTHSAAGTSGANGANGKDGAAGANGTNGASGKDGAAGSTGTAGASGTHGATGATGAVGATGQKGSTGVAGTNGSDGATGPQGDPGVQGEKGDTGAKGDTGDTGDTGAKGDTGATGASAPTYSTSPGDGEIPPIWAGPFVIGSLVGPIPAGPALVGFSLQMTTISADPVPVSCDLINVATNDVIIPGSPQTVATGSSYLFAGTVVVSLAGASTLVLQCTPVFPIDAPISYSSVSIYAISFATS